MNSQEYVKAAVATESNDWEKIEARLSRPTLRLLHSSMGMATETGEFVDALKKFIFYGKPIDKVNLTEELGDLFWYIAVACNELDLPFEQIWERNIAKLKARYEGRFNETGAVVRDLDRERRILESPK